VRILFLGDIVGTPGMTLVRKAVPKLRKHWHLDAVVVNAENAYHGSGLTPSLYRQLKEVGVDGITMGDHIYKKSDLIKILQETNCIVKPANYPDEAPGSTLGILPIGPQGFLAIVSVMGRSFMRAVDCPFQAIDRVLAQIPTPVKCILVDVHAEATADKYLMFRYLDGRVSAVLGTHTHVATADEQISPQGTAFQCDVGMCGPHNGIIGRMTERVLSHAITFVPISFEVATGEVRLNGALLEVNEQTGKATSIKRVRLEDSQFAEDVTPPNLEEL
jgi:hypothetical protein